MVVTIAGQGVEAQSGEPSGIPFSHTHSPSLSLALFLFLSFSPSLFLALFRFPSLFLSRSPSLSLALFLTHTPSETAEHCSLAAFSRGAAVCHAFFFFITLEPRVELYNNL